MAKKIKVGLILDISLYTKLKVYCSKKNKRISNVIEDLIRNRLN